MQAEVEERYTQYDNRQHAREKHMWLGSRERQTQVEYVVNQLPHPEDESKVIDVGVLETLDYTPALFKCVDEIVVNAIDQWTRYKDSTKKTEKVTYIKCELDEDTGAISISNNGPGIPVVVHSKYNVYIPQLIFASDFASGENLKSNPERTTGGTHGFGGKLVNFNSEWFRVVTVDGENKLKYSQLFEQGEDRLIKHNPTITKLRSANPVTFTQISFKPEYHRFGHDFQKDKHTLLKLIRTRMYQVSAYVGKGVKVYFNGELLKVTNLSDFAKLYSDNVTSTVVDYGNVSDSKSTTKTSTSTSTSTSTKSKSKSNNVSGANNQECRYPWEVCVGIQSDQDSSFSQISFINGMYIKKGGTHIKVLLKMLVNELKPKADRLFKKANSTVKKSLIENKLFMFMRGEVPNPGWNSQSKEELSVDERRFKHYVLKPAFVSSVWKKLEPYLEETLMTKLGDDSEKKTNTKRKVNVEKYEGATNAGTAKSMQCTCIICEGDSAAGMVRNGITDKKTKLSFNYYGIYNIRGVPMNARKECKVIERKKPDGTVELLKRRNEKLINNERLSSLIKVLGLDFNKKYETDAEFKTLRYGSVVIATDQDLDGLGNIFSLLLNFFSWFWPALVQRGFVKRLATPVIRAKKNKTVKEFFLEKDYEDWKKTNFGDREPVGYEVKYYKGLATHEKYEVTRIFQTYENNVVEYFLGRDPDQTKLAEDTMDAFFNNSTEPRKVELRTPVDYSLSTNGAKEVPVYNHMKVETKSYQLDNIERKMPHVVDGLNPSRRKILCGAIKSLAKSNRSSKVVELCGEVMKSMQYHHGDASLNGTIIAMAQNFLGKQNFPLLLGIGDFGSRFNATAGQPRYIHVKMNGKLVDKLFPRSDDYVLDYTFDEGRRSEPKYYVPVIPYVLLENTEIPLTGWKISCWARNHKEVIAIVRNMVNNNLANPPDDALLSASRINFSGEIVIKNGVEYSVGKYEVNEQKEEIHITELPIMTWTEVFKYRFLPDSTSSDSKEKNKPLKSPWAQHVLDINDHSGGDSISITIKLQKGTLDAIQKQKKKWVFDPITDTFHLAKSLNKSINIMRETGHVSEFENYMDIIPHWFSIRKDFYKRRLEQERVILRYQILKLENIARFVPKVKQYNLYELQPNQAETLLEIEGYLKLNTSYINSPHYLQADELEKAILNSTTASYSYLLNITYNDTLKNACQKRQTQLKELQTKLAQVEDDLCLKSRITAKTFPGKKTWLREINELERIMDWGLQNNWGRDRVEDIKWE